MLMSTTNILSNQSELLNSIKNGDIMSVLSYILNMPIAHVNRIEFLSKIYSVTESEIANNTYKVSFEERQHLAQKHINSTIVQTTAISFASGIPGGLAMAGTIPADILQNMIYSVRLAQQLAYIYDIDIENNNHIDTDAMLLFLGIMFGVNGAASLLRVTATNTGKYFSKKILKAGLSKTIWYPIFKKIVRIVSGKTLTIKALSNGASKFIPVIGGVTSGGVTFLGMKKSANLLNKELQRGYDTKYSEKEYQKDINILEGQFRELKTDD